MMKFIEVNRENKSVFKGVLGKEDLLIGEDPYLFAIGVVDETNRIPVGGLVFSMSHMPTVYLKWIYVDPRFRFDGIGTAMMEKFYDIVTPLAPQKVSVLFYHNAVAQMLISFLESFEYRFVRTITYGERMTLKALEMNPMVVQKKVPASICSLKDVSTSEVNQFLDQLPKDQYNGDRPLFDRKIDSDISSVYIKGDKVVGAFVVEAYSAYKLVPVLMFSLENEEKALDALFVKTVRSALTKYGEDDQIFLDCNEDAVMEYMRGLYPQIHPIAAWRGEYGFTASK